MQVDVVRRHRQGDVEAGGERDDVAEETVARGELFLEGGGFEVAHEEHLECRGGDVLESG